MPAPDAPTLSVIVPILDEAAHLPRLVGHLRERLPGAELVVVDGHSSDGSWELLEGLAVDQRLQAGPGRGLQLDAGARAARGEVLLFLHADARLPPGAREELLRVLSRPGVVAGAFRTWHRAEGEASRLMERLLHLADLRSRYTTLPYGDQGLFLRREVYEAVGGFPHQPLMEDLELSLRLRRRGGIGRARARVEVSGRRFQEGPIRYTLMVNLFPLLYRAGVSPERLARLYRDVRGRPAPRSGRGPSRRGSSARPCGGSPRRRP
ncbi:MAG: TIGR04283 family arsenosugar biosynthesis glycosyltransferase [Deltaproteobacteria bacterium]|nr:TIGR04283 family arsenosugar biosynthesis glycosyltransferase [Deltaproteobacteria bacterium]